MRRIRRDLHKIKLAEKNYQEHCERLTSSRIQKFSVKCYWIDTTIRALKYVERQLMILKSDSIQESPVINRIEKGLIGRTIPYYSAVLFKKLNAQRSSFQFPEEDLSLTVIIDTFVNNRECLIQHIEELKTERERMGLHDGETSYFVTTSILDFIKNVSNVSMSMSMCDYEEEIRNFYEINTFFNRKQK